MRFSVKSFAALWETALDAVLPPLCLSCQAPVAASQAVCAACWGQITQITAPCCVICGVPFEVEALTDSVCPACIAEPPLFGMARAPLVYDDFSRPLILGFKHADRTDAAPALAAWMRRAGQALLAECEVIVPVPLHRWRLFRRRYNQAALLAMRLGQMTDKEVVPDLLLRVRATPSQGHANRDDRIKNVRGAMAVHPRRLRNVAGKKILLVDDVMTTGATLNECTRVLLNHGAAGVAVLTLARTRRNQIFVDP